MLNNLGVVQLRRGGTPTQGVAAYFFNKAADADATEPDYFFNLGYAYWLAKDTQAAIYWLREAVRRDPTDGDAHYVLGAALAAAGRTSDATREKDLAKRLSSAYDEWDQRPPTDPIPHGLERVKGDVELPHARQIEETLATAQRDQRELASFYLDRARRLVEQESDREAIAELNRVLFLSPYDAEAHLLLGRVHLRAGRARDAIDALKISLWSAASADAHALLAEAYFETKDLAGARREAEQAAGDEPGAPGGNQPAGASASALMSFGCVLKSTRFGSNNFPRRRLPRDSAERQTAGLPVHGGHGGSGRDLPDRGTCGPRRPRRAIGAGRGRRRHRVSHRSTPCCHDDAGRRSDQGRTTG